MRKIQLKAIGYKGKSAEAVVGAFIEQVAAGVKEQVAGALEGGLEQEADGVVGRGAHERRVGQGWQRVGNAECRRCGSRRCRDFVRNGRRRRTVLTLWGTVVVWLPRLRCACGGSVRVHYRLLQPYQRYWTDVEQQVQQWAEWGVSLRQMQARLSELLCSSVGLSTLNSRLNAVKRRLPIALSSVPPVLLLDAIWTKVVATTAQLRTDRLGRRRAVKRKRKVAVLVGLGVWPQTGHWQVLDWEIACGEDTNSWEALLLRLEERGVYRERGLSLIVHDGGKGLTAILNRIYPTIPHQRCIFHKLRNLAQLLLLDPTLTPTQVSAFRQSILSQATAIFRAPSQAQALHLWQAFQRQWSTTQSQAVQALQRDLDLTLAFYSVLQRFPSWHASALRTTSVLERLNRFIRRLFRAAGAFHSFAGLTASLIRTLTPFMAR